MNRLHPTVNGAVSPIFLAVSAAKQPTSHLWLGFTAHERFVARLSLCRFADFYKAEIYLIGKETGGAVVFICSG